MSQQPPQNIPSATSTPSRHIPAFSEPCDGRVLFPGKVLAREGDVEGVLQQHEYCHCAQGPPHALVTRRRRQRGPGAQAQAHPPQRGHHEARHGGTGRGGGGRYGCRGVGGRWHCGCCIQVEAVEECEDDDEGEVDVTCTMGALCVQLMRIGALWLH